MKKIIGVILGIIMIICVAVEMSADAAQKFKIVGYVKGDVNLDGKIDSVDASMVLWEYVNVSTGKGRTMSLTQHFIADVNSDNTVDSADASIIFDIYVNTTTGNNIPKTNTVWFQSQFKANGKTVNLTATPTTYEECMAAIEAHKLEKGYDSSYQYSVWATYTEYGDYISSATTTVYRETEKGIEYQNRLTKNP